MERKVGRVLTCLLRLDFVDFCKTGEGGFSQFVLSDVNCSSFY